MNKLQKVCCCLFHNLRIVRIILMDKIFPLFPDKSYLSIMYRLYFGRKLDWEHPVTFNEKLQWLKLYNRKPEYTVMVDKVKVKDYVAEKLGEEYIIPTLGVWDDPDDIDFDALPNQFVLKCNHNSGLGMCICKDKSKLDISKVKAELRKGLRQNYFLRYREWPYKDVPRKILAEKYMVDNEQVELKDYKFFCFNGEPCLCQVISDRSTDEKIDFYDMDWHQVKGLLGLVNDFSKIHNSEEEIPCPTSYDQMKQMANELAQNIPFSRIDLYEINGKPYFGEITFFPASGFAKFRPDEWNKVIGDWVKIIK